MSLASTAISSYREQHAAELHSIQLASGGVADPIGQHFIRLKEFDHDVSSMKADTCRVCRTWWRAVMRMRCDAMRCNAMQCDAMDGQMGCDAMRWMGG